MGNSRQEQEMVPWVLDQRIERVKQIECALRGGMQVFGEAVTGFVGHGEARLLKINYWQRES